MALGRCFQDHIGGLLGDHDGGSVGVARHQRGMTEASTTRRPSTPMHAQLRVDHGIRPMTHLAGADRVVDGRAGHARVVQQGLVADQVRAAAIIS